MGSIIQRYKTQNLWFKRHVFNCVFHGKLHSGHKETQALADGPCRGAPDMDLDLGLDTLAGDTDLDLVRDLETDRSKDLLLSLLKLLLLLRLLLRLLDELRSNLLTRI